MTNSKGWTGEVYYPFVDLMSGLTYRKKTTPQSSPSCQCGKANHLLESSHISAQSVNPETDDGVDGKGSPPFGRNAPHRREIHSLESKTNIKME